MIAPRVNWSQRPHLPLIAFVFVFFFLFVFVFVCVFANVRRRMISPGVNWSQRPHPPLIAHWKLDTAPLTQPSRNKGGNNPKEKKTILPREDLVGLNPSWLVRLRECVLGTFMKLVRRPSVSLHGPIWLTKYLYLYVYLYVLFIFIFIFIGDFHAL